MLDKIPESPHPRAYNCCNLRLEVRLSVVRVDALMVGGVPFGGGGSVGSEWLEKN